MTRSQQDAELPVLRTARRAGLIEQVIEQLRSQIGAGAWPVGSRIPTETALARITGTSRNTVREAVQSLVHTGLLERRQGSGTYVLASSELAGAAVRRVTGAARPDVLEVRYTLETGTARLAAMRRDADDVRELQDLVEQHDALRTGDDPAQLLAVDRALRRAVARAARNPVLRELHEHVLAASQPDAGTGRDEALRRTRRPLVQAITDGDPDRATMEAARALTGQHGPLVVDVRAFDRTAVG